MPFGNVRVLRRSALSYVIATSDVPCVTLVSRFVSSYPYVTGSWPCTVIVARRSAASYVGDRSFGRRLSQQPIEVVVGARDRPVGWRVGDGRQPVAGIGAVRDD